MEEAQMLAFTIIVITTFQLNLIFRNKETRFIFQEVGLRHSQQKN